MRVPAQGRLVVRPARQQQQRPRARDPVKGLAEELQGGGVDPVRILDYHQHRSATREAEELLDQHGQRAGTPLLRREVFRRVACARVYPEQLRDQRRRLFDVLHALTQQRLELVELRCLGVGRRQARGVTELLGHRPKRRTGVKGRALVAERDVLAPGDRVERGLDQPGLADAGLADQEHRLALAGHSLPPPLEHERQLLVAPDHGQRPARSWASKRLPVTRSPRTANPLTGWAKPLSRVGPSSRSSNISPKSRRVPSAITTAPGVAASCSLAARFGVSPTTDSSRAAPSPTRSPTTTRPVAMPTRAASGSPAGVESWLTALVIARPACTARSASSSAPAASRNRPARHRP